MTPHLRGRATAVPHRLLIGAPNTSLDLVIADRAVIEGFRGSCTSTARSIERAIAADWHEQSLLRAHYPGLFDELSAFAQLSEPFEPESLLAKTLWELDVVQKLEKVGLGQGLSDPNAFVDLLLGVHRGIGGGISSFRKTSVVIRPDDAGNVTVFPPWQLCRPLVEDLGTFLCRYAQRFPGLCAVVAYAGIIHAHPFRDGNGRTARVVLNLVLRTSTGTPHFLPLSKLAHLSDRGFLIKLRRALYGGEWEPLMAFTRDAVRLSKRIQCE
ncbi:Fic family protein [Sphingomonas sp. CJ20]